MKVGTAEHCCKNNLNICCTYLSSKHSLYHFSQKVLGFLNLKKKTCGPHFLKPLSKRKRKMLEQEHFSGKRLQQNRSIDLYNTWVVTLNILYTVRMNTLLYTHCWLPLRAVISIIDSFSAGKLCNDHYPQSFTKAFPSLRCVSLQ